MANETTKGEAPPADIQRNEHMKSFFLDLASKGKEAWNAWRRDPTNKDARVTFAGTDFSEAPKDQINFAGFEFGDHADFSRCKWRGREWTDIQENPEAFAPGRAFFAGAAFGDRASFTGAVFGDCADFTRVTFVEAPFFCGATFGDFARFNSIRFGNFAVLSVRPERY